MSAQLTHIAQGQILSSLPLITAYSERSTSHRHLRSMEWALHNRIDTCIIPALPLSPFPYEYHLPYATISVLSRSTSDLVESVPKHLLPSLFSVVRVLHLLENWRRSDDFGSCSVVDIHRCSFRERDLAVFGDRGRVDRGRSCGPLLPCRVCIFFLVPYDLPPHSLGTGGRVVKGVMLEVSLRLVLVPLIRTVIVNAGSSLGLGLASTSLGCVDRCGGLGHLLWGTAPHFIC